MKVCSLLFLILFSAGVTAQPRICGIYRSASDFTLQHLSYGSTHTRLRLHPLFNRNILGLRYKDSLFRFKKQEIYGYLDHDGLTYRFFDGNTYQLINAPGNILLYKISKGPALKGQEEQFLYYFSKDALHPLIPLCLKNLQQAFEELPAFQRLLEFYFKTNDSLLEYDRIHSSYKINRLFELSTHQNPS